MTYIEILQLYGLFLNAKFFFHSAINNRFSLYYIFFVDFNAHNLSQKL